MKIKDSDAPDEGSVKVAQVRGRGNKVVVPRSPCLAEN
jgi:hypothetical protein